ncbi:hypothetical protein Syun_031692 [Stephania yunnanensis]|uniref:Uncharacterized protein n=1 Tax=Stephania yunnanensis TaxID=152371 RepID=A0AAP0DWP1_9MAGN
MQTPSGSASPSSSPHLALVSHHHLDLPFPPALAVSRSPVATAAPLVRPHRLTRVVGPLPSPSSSPARQSPPRCLTNCAASPPHWLTGSPPHRLTGSPPHPSVRSARRPLQLSRSPLPSTSPVHHNSASPLSLVGRRRLSRAPLSAAAQRTANRASPATAVTPRQSATALPTHLSALNVNFFYSFSIHIQSMFLIYIGN